jgi:hypothetical protein
MPQNTLTTTDLILTSLSNVGGNFTAKWNGKTSLQPIGTDTVKWSVVGSEIPNTVINIYNS